MDGLSRASILGIVALMGFAGTRVRPEPPERFRHVPHEAVTTTCEMCHRIEPDRATMPEPELCAACHDGTTARRVDWDGPTSRPSNLVFRHGSVLEAKREKLGWEFACLDCHQVPGGSPMEVGRPAGQPCMSCHAPDEDHLIGAPCADHHVPLAEARGYGVDDVKGFPRPGDHGEAWVLRHRGAALENEVRCGICHRREWCTGCHVNAPEAPATQAPSCSKTQPTVNR